MTEPAQTALLALDALTRRLRRECPWDREQDERSIVPHTVEEAYELADAAHSGDDAKLVDELGDVLFQVHFLACCSRSGGPARSPPSPSTAPEADPPPPPHLRRDDGGRRRGGVAQLGSDQAHPGGPRHGLFGDLPENLPALSRARKAQRRVASSGFDFPGVDVAADAVREELGELERAAEPRRALPRGRRRAVRRRQRRPQARYRSRACPARGHRPLLRARRRRRGQAAAAGEHWSELPLERQLEHYARARLRESPKGGQ